MDVRRDGTRSRTLRARSYLWVVLPLALGVPAMPSFLWASWRLRSRRLAIEAVVYGVATVAFFWLAGRPSETAATVGGLIGLCVMVVPTARAFVLRRRVFGLSEVPIARPVETGAPAPPWSPPWSTDDTTPPTTPADPHDPSTWVLPFACTGDDRHELGPPLSRTYAYGSMGVALLALGLVLHTQDRSLWLGFGFLVVPLSAVLFAQRVDGPTLRYRTFGVPRTLRLDEVITVAVRRPSTLVLSDADGRTARVGATTDSLVREHLRGWLAHPGVAMSPGAAALLGDDSSTAQPRIASRRARQLRVVAVYASLVLIAVGGVLGHQRAEARKIDGASGYRTFTGPRGKVPITGRPWGLSCQPVLLTPGEEVPVWVDVQVAAVVEEARRDGIDVGLRTSTDVWDPASLYYPVGLTAADVALVGIFVDSESPRLSNGDPERLNIGWDTASTPDGVHEYLVRVQGVLHLPALTNDGPATRRAVRQLIAFTQGVDSSTVDGSGIKSRSTVDAFSERDVAAMKLMSGCGDAPASTVARPR